MVACEDVDSTKPVRPPMLLLRLYNCSYSKSAFFVILHSPCCDWVARFARYVFSNFMSRLCTVLLMCRFYANTSKDLGKPIVSMATPFRLWIPSHLPSFPLCYNLLLESHCSETACVIRILSSSPSLLYEQ